MSFFRFVSLRLLGNTETEDLNTGYRVMDVKLDHVILINRTIPWKIR